MTTHSIVQYYNYIHDCVYLPGEWSSPNITGQPPPPCSHFTLTRVDERRAALFGGWSGSGESSDDLFIIELSKNTMVRRAYTVMRIRL